MIHPFSNSDLGGETPGYRRSPIPKAVCFTTEGHLPGGCPVSANFVQNGCDVCGRTGLKWC
jgi:hypothetical protein